MGHRERTRPLPRCASIATGLAVVLAFPALLPAPSACRPGRGGCLASAFVAGRRAAPSASWHALPALSTAARSQRRAGEDQRQIRAGLEALADSERQGEDRGQPAAKVVKSAGRKPWAKVLSAIQDFYNETIAPEAISRAAKDFYDYEEGDLKGALESLDKKSLAKLRLRGAALTRLLGKSQAAGDLRKALFAQAAVLASFADKARALASSPTDFISGLSEVFRSVEDVEEAARLAVVDGSAAEEGPGRVGAVEEPPDDTSPPGYYGLAVHDSAARRGKEGEWIVPVQAWIYRRNEARHKIRMALCRKLLIEMYHGISDIDAQAKQRYEERGRLIFRTLAFRGGERNSDLEVKVDGETAWRPLPPTGGDGRVETEVAVEEEVVERAAQADPDPLGRRFVGFRVRIAGHKANVANVTQRARAILTESDGVLVISDIDDTVKVTEVFLGEDMIVRNTFLEEFRAVGGMVPLYRSWAEDFGAAFAFVSNSPPEFQELLRDFLAESGFPRAPIHLRPLGGTKEERRSFKLQKIKELLAQFPRRKVVLVGDSGERDPLICAELLREYPEQVVKALIRQVHPNRPVDPAVFEGLARERWQVFADPMEAELPGELRGPSVSSFLLSQAEEAARLLGAEAPA